MRTPFLGLATAAAVCHLTVQAQAQDYPSDAGVLYGRSFTVAPVAGHEQTPPNPALIEAIGAWISSSLGLPIAPQPPKLRIVSPEGMWSLRHRDVPSDHMAGATIGRSAADVSKMKDILALYDDESRTIYLLEDWRGETAAELSIVVHEMVHHLQNVADLRFECPAAREEQAFEVQNRWLALFGTDLATEFGLDPFTLLVRTTCQY